LARIKTQPADLGSGVGADVSSGDAPLEEAREGGLALIDGGRGRFLDSKNSDKERSYSWLFR
jgi:hypothetical protein